MESRTVEWQGIPASTAVVVPFKDGFETLPSCLGSVLKSLPDGARVVAIDDGSERDPCADSALAPLLVHPAAVLLRHAHNRGPAAARNTGFDWCWQHGIDTVILLDSDCVAPDDFVVRHLAHHHAHPEALCVGGAIKGQGDGFWARLDNILSWFTAVPRPDCVVTPPLHIPTTNMSLKLRPSCRELLRFRAYLRTGEDVALIQDLRRAGQVVRFNPSPCIVHIDRATFRAFIRHQYRWGLHTFAVRFQAAARSRALGLAFALAFVPAAPLYAALATWLNMRPWLAYNRADWPLVPVVYLVYLLKAIAVVHGAVRPEAALYLDERS
jgi:glycosyltransferase involved in cell wall biosynthesis